MRMASQKKISVTKKVIEFSYQKAKSVLKKIKYNNFIIISADTEVFRCGNTFSKCKSKNEVKNYYYIFQAESI